MLHQTSFTNNPETMNKLFMVMNATPNVGVFMIWNIDIYFLKRIELLCNCITYSICVYRKTDTLAPPYPTPFPFTRLCSTIPVNYTIRFLLLGNACWCYCLIRNFIVSFQTSYTIIHFSLPLALFWKRLVYLRWHAYYLDCYSIPFWD